MCRLKSTRSGKGGELWYGKYNINLSNELTVHVYKNTVTGMSSSRPQCLTKKMMTYKNGKKKMAHKMKLSLNKIFI